MQKTTNRKECGTNQTAALLSNEAAMYESIFDSTASVSAEMKREETHQPLLKSYNQKMYTKLKVKISTPNFLKNILGQVLIPRLSHV